MRKTPRLGHIADDTSDGAWLIVSILSAIVALGLVLMGYVYWWPVSVQQTASVTLPVELPEKGQDRLSPPPTKDVFDIWTLRKTIKVEI